MSKSSVTKRDLGLNRIIADMHNLDRHTVKIGVQSDAGENDGVAIAVYAFANEFGATIPVEAQSRQVYFKRNRDGSAGNRFVKKSKSDFAQWATRGAHTIKIPERSFMRSTFDEELPQLNKRINALFDQVIKGRITPKRALDMLGMNHGKQIQLKITRLRTPPNAPSTIRRKKSSNPLIDSGQMRASIRHVVEVK